MTAISNVHRTATISRLTIKQQTAGLYALDLSLTASAALNDGHIELAVDDLNDGLTALLAVSQDSGVDESNRYASNLFMQQHILNILALCYSYRYAMDTSVTSKESVAMRAHSVVTASAGFFTELNVDTRYLSHSALS
jgi:hypothetical protein